MEFITAFIDLVLHLDQHLTLIIQNHGAWVYLVLFLIIFCETGLVVTPFLPGDSLLFVAGTLAAAGGMDIQILMALLIAASFLGDNTNYWVGRALGPKVFSSQKSRFLNREHLNKAHAFYEKHGGKAIIFARFIPIIRTFAPFVAGIGRMAYQRFITFSIVGSVSWISFFVLGGYFFGNIPAVKQNLTLVMLGIIFISILPGIIQYWQHRRSQS